MQIRRRPIRPSNTMFAQRHFRVAYWPVLPLSSRRKSWLRNWPDLRRHLKLAAFAVLDNPFIEIVSLGESCQQPIHLPIDVNGTIIQYGIFSVGPTWNVTYGDFDAKYLHGAGVNPAFAVHCVARISKSCERSTPVRSGCTLSRLEID